jgi:Fe2+ or Zn2+ uptake regulation protein
MISSMDKLKELLASKGLKSTYQRLKILEYMNQHMNIHPTAEMIYEALIEKIPTISITTVYNTLNTFVGKGLIAEVTITGTEMRYDFHTSPHQHFLCKSCGKIIDLDMECPLTLNRKDKICGHRIDEMHGYLKGICKDCLKKQNRKNKH